MSLYADYIKEREGYDTYEDNNSFFTYTIVNDALYVKDIYIKPEARSEGKSLELGLMAEGIAKELGLNAMLGSVDTGTEGWRRSKKILEKFGYKEVFTDGTMIYLNKDIN